MKAGRTSIGSRLISMLLVVVMVLGMVPFSAFAAVPQNTETSNNVSKIMILMKDLMNKAFSYVESPSAGFREKDGLWDTENKSKNWTYYNGIMVDSFIMNGFDVTSGNALEFADKFYHYNIANGDPVYDYKLGELDSIAPARGVFDLLGTVLDKQEYHTLIQKLYTNLEGQALAANSGGNFQHKDKNSTGYENWKTYQIALDGIYMSHPFLMECANAIDEGKLSLTDKKGNPVKSADIYAAEHKRLMWIADNMYDQTAHLYHHGWNPEKQEGNNVFWLRAIGWYAAGLADVIEMMPKGSSYQTDLIANLKKLLDGVMEYQDTEANAAKLNDGDTDYTGMWYNVVNQPTVANNELETSGTALLAYAMLKAYNNGWLGEAYGKAGLTAFNGIMANRFKNNKDITLIYKSASVYGDPALYCDANLYKTNEAKGIGPLLMAASIANDVAVKLNLSSESTTETFTTGVVVAPKITIAKGKTPDYSGVKITLVGSQGTIKNVSPSDKNLTFEAVAPAAVGDTAGNVTVSAKYNGSTIGTFTVNVVDASVPTEKTGTVGIESAVTDPPAGPNVTAGNWAQISGTGTTTYELDTDGINDIGTDSTAEYIIVDYYNGNAYALGNENGSEKAFPVTVSADGKTVTIDSTIVANALWKFTTRSENMTTFDGITAQGYTISNGSYYVRQDNNTVITDDIGKANVAAVASDQSNGTYRIMLTTEKALNLVGSADTDWRRGEAETATDTVYLFKAKTTPAETKFVRLSGDKTYAYKVGTTTNILGQIQNDYKVQTSTIENDPNPTTLEKWENESTVSHSWGDTPLDTTKAGTYTLTVQAGTQTIGIIPVLIYGDTVTTDHAVSLSVTPGAIVATAGDNTTIQLNPTVTVKDLNGNTLNGCTSTVTYGGGANGIATVDTDGLVTIGGKGETTITVTVSSISYNGKDYTVSDVVASIPVTVNEKVVVATPTYALSGLTVTPTSIAQNEKAQAIAYVKASDNVDKAYTIEYSISKGGDLATIDSATGVITPKGTGEVTVQAKLTKVDGKDFTVTDGGTATLTATLTVTAATDPEPTSEPTSEPTTEPTSEPTTEPTTETTPAAGYVYELDTNGIDDGETYVLVDLAPNGNYYAFSHDKEATSNQNGLAAEVRYDIDSKRITFVNASDVELSEWKFDLRTKADANGYATYRVTIANTTYSGWGIRTSENSNPLTKQDNDFTVKDQSNGDYRASRKTSDTGENVELMCDGSAWKMSEKRDGIHDTIMLFKKVAVTEAVLAPASLTMDLFGTVTPDIQVVYNKQKLQPGDYTLSWDLGGSEAVSQENGVLTAKKPGEATITVKLTHVGTEDVSAKNLTATIAVKVAAPTLSISPATVKMYLGSAVPQEETVTAKVTGASGNDLTDQATIVWSSENTDNCVEFVEATGKVTAKAVGNATITATLTKLNGQALPDGVAIASATCAVTVEQRGPNNFELTPTVVNIAVGDASETQGDREARIMAALNPIVVSVYYNDETSSQSTVGQLVADTKYSFEGINTVDTDTKGTYKVTFKYTDASRPDRPVIERPITVHVVDKASAESDGFINWELTPEYKKVDKIESGKEYLIVAFPKSGDTENGYLLSNGNATNEEDARALSVSAIVKPVEDPNKPDYVTIDWKTNGDTRKTDFLWKWTFSYQTESNNYFIYNFRHRIGADEGCRKDEKDTQLRMKSRFTGDNRVVVTRLTSETEKNVYTLTAKDPTNNTNYIYHDGTKWNVSNSVSSDKANTNGYKVYLYERVTETDRRDVKFSVPPTIDAHIGMTYDITPTIEVKYANGEYNPAGQRNIHWTSSDTTVATVDPNTGKVSALKAGTATITATLFIVDGEEVTPNSVVDENGQTVYPNNGSGVVKTVRVNVGADTPQYALQGNETTVRLGGDVDYSKASIKMSCTDHNLEETLTMSHPDVEVDPLSAVADPNVSPDLETNKKPLNTDVAGDYYVPVYHLATPVGYVKVTVDPDPYHDLTVTKTYPEYPNAGGVRLQKFGTGGDRFRQTGLAHIELTTAGVSAQSNVDVVLIVDVSNSMAWSMNWFDGLSDTKVKEADDTDKIPKKENGQDATDDKLDMAMKYATEFATTLLSGNSGNTLSFVTFAGADLQNRTDNAEGTNYVDSVKTVFYSVTNLEQAKASFANTKFTHKDPKLGSDGKQTGSVNYSLQIAGTDGIPFADANGTEEQLNRGNTNYDYAFGQAIEAVKAIKDKYAQDNSGKSYDESGRQLQVVFMTDGAPSHYNGERFAVTTGYDALWGSKDGAAYDNFVPSENATTDEEKRQEWLAYIGEYNTLATQLYGMVTGMHLVGFDLNHGGFGKYSFTSEELVKVLRGVVQNKVLDGEQAENEAALDEYFDRLAKSLTLAATDAKVTDVIGDDFVLYTGKQGNDTTKGILPFITVQTYELVSKAEAEADTTGTLHAGERKGEPTVLETITFNADGKVSSEYLEGTEKKVITDIRTETGYKGKYFTYDSASKKFTWNIGDMENKQYSLSYYVYLTNTLDGTKDRENGNYPTNNYATLDYVDIYGDHASRPFPVPQVAWGRANIGVLFYLVNNKGEYVNRSGAVFTDKANRVFLAERVYYNGELDVQQTVVASTAFNDAKLVGNYSLYKDGTVYVTGSEDATKAKVQITQDGTDGLINAYDLANEGKFLHTIVEIPVQLDNLGSTDKPLIDDAVVMDYGLPITIDVLGNEAKRTAANADGTTVDVTQKVIGFVPYSPIFETTNYIGDSSVNKTSPFVTNCGEFTISSDGKKVVYTPTKMLDGVQKVFVAVELHPEGTSEAESKILLSTLTIVPATIVYYETDGKMAPAYTYTGVTGTNEWKTESEANITAATMQDDYKPGADVYGYDSNYLAASNYSNGSSMRVEGVNANDTKATFTFTGTGFDIISRTGTAQGTIRVWVTNNATKEVKKIVLINQGKTDLYQIPVVSVDNLKYGTYTVEIGVLGKQVIPNVLEIGNVFYFDAVRIYGTAAGTEMVESAVAATTDGTTTYTNSDTTVKKIYEADGEANTVFSEIRDNLINAESFGEYGDASTPTPGAMYIEGMANGEKPMPADYAGQGPNNEVYLGKGNGIAFSFKITDTNKALHLGMKSADGSKVTAKVTIVANGQKYPTETGAKEITIQSSTAQFYDLLKETGFTGTGTVQVVISNASTTGNGILSLTDLKYTDGSKFVVDAETLEDAKYAASKQLNVATVALPEEVTSVRRAEVVKLSVTTEANVTQIRITNAFGAVVWSKATPVDTDNSGATEKVWDVELRPLLLGNQTYTILGLNDNGEYGNSQEVKIEVTLY